MINYNKILIENALINNIAIVKNALGKGADVNYQNKDGTTALIVAAWKGYSELVKILLENPDIKLSLKNKFDFSAYAIAHKKASNSKNPQEIEKYLEIMKLLEIPSEK